MKTTLATAAKAFSTMAFGLALVASMSQTTRAQFANDHAKRLHKLVNEYRVANKLGELGTQSTLMSVAQKHAENMARQENMSHELDGKGPSDRVKASGYQSIAVAENVGVNSGYLDPALKQLNGWKNSSGHNKTMKTWFYNQTGIGAAKSRSGAWYFCQVYARPLSCALTTKVEIKNVSNSTIKYTIAGSSYSIGPGRTKTHTNTTADGKVPYGIDYPTVCSGGLCSSGSEIGWLQNNKRYKLTDSSFTVSGSL